MKILFFIILSLFIYSCNKPNTVLICGDHICVNKAEAEQFFKDNLSLEVQIIDKKKSNTIDLVELNLKSNDKGVKSVNIFKKDKTKNKLKILSPDQIKKKKAEVKIREKIKQAKLNEINDRHIKKKDKKLFKQKNENKVIKKDDKKIKEKEIKLTKQKQAKKLINTKKTVNKSKSQIDDVCIVLEKCNIDEISKYLINRGKKNSFPDITKRE